MVRKFKKSIEKAVKLLYSGNCTVYRYKNIKEKGITRQESEKLYENIKCRLSYEKSPTATESECVSRTEQEIKLFMGNEWIIKGGDIIYVEQNGHSEKYCACGRAEIYGGHQEIRVKIFDEDV